jgi:hypothetical protein
MDDVHKLSVLATEAHSSDVAVNSAAKKAQKAADTLSSAEEKIEGGDKTVLDDIKIAVDAAASLNTVVQAAERRLADVAGADEDDEDDDERETDSKVSVPAPEPASAQVTLEESVSISESEKENDNDLSAAVALSVDIPPAGPVSSEEQQMGKEAASNLFNNSNDLFENIQNGKAAASDFGDLLESVEAGLKKTQQAIIDQDSNGTNRLFLQAVSSSATVSAIADTVVNFVEKHELDKAARAAKALESEQATLKDKVAKCVATKHHSSVDASLDLLSKTAASLDGCTQTLIDAVQAAAANPQDETMAKAAIKASDTVRKVSDELVDTALEAKKQASPEAEHKEGITKATISAAKSRAAVVAVRASFNEEAFDTKLLLSAAQDLSFKMTDLAACLSGLDFLVPAVVPVEEKKPEPVPEPAPAPIVEEKQAEPALVPVPEPAPVVEEKQPEPVPVPVPEPAPVVEEKKPEPKPDSARDVYTPRGSKKNALDALIGRTLSRSLSGAKLADDKPVEAVIDEVAKSLETSGPESEGTKDIAETLRNLATAARAGKKEDMQSSARILSSQLSDLVKRGREVHKLEPAGIPRNIKMNYEALGKACDSLSNYSTQIRIVVNVKVNSSGNSDGDEALSSLAKSIGLAVREITSNMGKVKAAK